MANSASKLMSINEPEDWRTWKNELRSSEIIPGEQRDSRSLFFSLIIMGSLPLYNFESVVSMDSCRCCFPALPASQKEEKSLHLLEGTGCSLCAASSPTSLLHRFSYLYESGWCNRFEISHVRVFQGHYSVWLVSASPSQDNVPATGDVDKNWFICVLVACMESHSICAWPVFKSFWVIDLKDGLVLITFITLVVKYWHLFWPLQQSEKKNIAIFCWTNCITIIKNLF